MEYKYTFTDDEILALNHDLMDIADWVNKAIKGKINSCIKRAAQEYRESMKLKGEKTVPVDDVECANNFFKSKDYKDRSEREEEFLKQNRERNNDK